MKSKKVEVLIKAIIPVIIIAGCFGIEKVISMGTEKSFDKPIIVNSDDLSQNDNTDSLEVLSKESFGDVKGLTENFGFKSDNEILLGIGLTREEFYKKYPKELDKGDEKNNKLLEEQTNDAYCGRVYEFNLADSTKKSLDIDVRDLYSDLVSERNNITYVKDNKYYIYVIIM